MSSSPWAQEFLFPEPKAAHIQQDAESHVESF